MKLFKKDKAMKDYKFTIVSAVCLTFLQANNALEIDDLHVSELRR